MTYLESLESAAKTARDNYVLYCRGPFPDPDRQRELHSAWFTATRAVNRERQSLAGGGSYRQVDNQFTKVAK